MKSLSSLLIYAILYEFKLLTWIVRVLTWSARRYTNGRSVFYRAAVFCKRTDCKIEKISDKGDRKRHRPDNQRLLNQWCQKRSSCEDDKFFLWERCAKRPESAACWPV